MRAAYRFLAAIIAVEVAIQAMAMVFAIAGLYQWISGGGVLNQAALESGEGLFPEEIGFAIHAMNGMMVMPVLALLLLIVSFFARVPGGVKWAGLVLGLVVLQVALGLGGHSAAILGALHGLNALALFSAAIYAARLTRKVAPAPPEADARVAAAG